MILSDDETLANCVVLKGSLVRTFWCFRFLGREVFSLGCFPLTLVKKGDENDLRSAVTMETLRESTPFLMGRIGAVRSRKVDKVVRYEKELDFLKVYQDLVSGSILSLL